MPRQPKPNSDLVELLKLLRRIVVLGVAAIGLAQGMPYPTLAFRLALLWAVLYISSGFVDVAFRHLSYRAARRQESEAAPENKGSSLPVPAGNRNP